MLKLLTCLKTGDDAKYSHFHIKSMKNSRRFTQINRVLRFGSGVALISAAAAMALVAVKPSNPSLATSQELQWTEDGKMSAAFAKHREDLFAARVGAAGESPTSWADENYQLNGGDQITAGDIVRARAAFSAIQKKGVGNGKNSTTAWFKLGPTKATYPAFLNRHGSQYVASGRITALAITPNCTPQQCTIWVGAAGDAEAGVGVYKSTDGGNTWTPLGGNSNFTNRATRTIAVDNFNDPTGNTIYVTSGRGVHGISSTTAGAVSQIPPGTPGVGVWKSTDGGATFTQLQHSTFVIGPQPGQTFESTFGSSRGATAFAVDPTHSGVIYASAYNVGIWRSTDNGATWTQIHAVTNTGAMRSEFAVATTPDNHTRMYSGEGDSGSPFSRVFVAEAVETGAPAFVQK